MKNFATTNPQEAIDESKTSPKIYLTKNYPIKQLIF